MADNLAVAPGVGATIRFEDSGGILHQMVLMEWGGAGVQNRVALASPFPVTVGNGTQQMPSGDAAARSIYVVQAGVVNPTANFNRPADTTAYTSGDLVANSVTAGSVTPMSWTATRVATGNASVRRCRLRKTNPVITNAVFRLHLFTAAPTVATTGDNAAFATDVSGYASYLGYLDVTAMQGFADGAAGLGAPGFGTEIGFALASGSTIYGLLEARGAYTPTSGETFTAELEVWVN